MNSLGIFLAGERTGLGLGMGALAHKCCKVPLAVAGLPGTGDEDGAGLGRRFLGSIIGAKSSEVCGMYRI